MWLQRIFGRILSSPMRGSVRNRRPRGWLSCEPLENREVPATINWVNMGLANDGFAAVFGAKAGQARAVVNAAIDSWERVISDFNNGANKIDLTIRMATEADADTYGFGGGDITSTAGQCPPGGIAVDDGKPVSALILLGRGNDGHGSGYFIDPTPTDHSEFQGTMTNAFVAHSDDPALAGKADFYSLALAELTHAIGITSKSGSTYKDLIDADGAAVNGVTLTDTGMLDA